MGLEPTTFFLATGCSIFIDFSPCADICQKLLKIAEAKGL
jgi:hypothetical protein